VCGFGWRNMLIIIRRCQRQKVIIIFLITILIKIIVNEAEGQNLPSECSAVLYRVIWSVSSRFLSPSKLISQLERHKLTSISLLQKCKMIGWHMQSRLMLFKAMIHGIQNQDRFLQTWPPRVSKDWWIGPFHAATRHIWSHVYTSGWYCMQQI